MSSNNITVGPRNAMGQAKNGPTASQIGGTKFLHACGDASACKNTEESFTLLHRAVGSLPEKEAASYFKAMAQCPHLVRKESNPSRYLELCAGDAHQAASRLASYWRKRESLFGAERAFMPMTLSHGALTEADVEVLETGYLSFLPKDSRGRNVLLFNNSRTDPLLVGRDAGEARFRCLFYMLSAASEEKSPLTILRFGNTAKWDKVRAGKILSVVGAMPLEISAMVYLFMPPAGARRMFKTNVLPLFMEHTKQHGVASKSKFFVGESPSDLMEYLSQEFGLVEASAPPCLGGTLSSRLFRLWLESRYRTEGSMAPSQADRHLQAHRRSVSDAEQPPPGQNGPSQPKPDQDKQDGPATRMFPHHHDHHHKRFVSEVSQSPEARLPAVQPMPHHKRAISAYESSQSGVKSVANDDQALTLEQRLQQAPKPLEAPPRPKSPDGSIKPLKAALKEQAQASKTTGLEELVAAADKARQQDRKARKRQMDAVYARKRRKREKEEEEHLKAACQKLSRENLRLRNDEKHFTDTLMTARARIATMESTPAVPLASPTIPSVAPSLPPAQLTTVLQQLLASQQQSKSSAVMQGLLGKTATASPNTALLAPANPQTAQLALLLQHAFSSQPNASAFTAMNQSTIEEALLQSLLQRLIAKSSISVDHLLGQLLQQTGAPAPQATEAVSTDKQLLGQLLGVNASPTPTAAGLSQLLTGNQNQGGASKDAMVAALLQQVANARKS